MGGLKKYMPITYWTSLVGTLALIGFPLRPKDALIEAVARPVGGGSATLTARVDRVFVTALYSFRLLFLVFTAGSARRGEGAPARVAVVFRVPLVCWRFLRSSSAGRRFDGVRRLLRRFRPAGQRRWAGWRQLPRPAGYILHAFQGPVPYLAAPGRAGLVSLPVQPGHGGNAPPALRCALHALVNKYYFDEVNQRRRRRQRAPGNRLWRIGDVLIIDGGLVNGSAKLVGWASGVLRRLQSGYLYHYAFAMIVGLVLLLGWLLVGTWPVGR